MQQMLMDCELRIFYKESTKNKRYLYYMQFFTNHPVYLAKLVLQTFLFKIGTGTELG